MDDDEVTVRRLLAAAGFDPPEADIAALTQSYLQTRWLAASLFAVAEARDELPALGFRVEAAESDGW